MFLLENDPKVRIKTAGMLKMSLTSTGENVHFLTLHHKHHSVSTVALKREKSTLARDSPEILE